MLDDKQKTLIKNIWSKYSKSKVPYSKIENMANKKFLEGKKKYKIGTYLSWWTRYFVKK
jgi:hypothetical protein